jgi:hypothetical protein
MFCPLCKAEYREGFTRCSECQIDLVESLVELPEEDDPLQIVWRGSDPVAFSRVMATLDEQGIEYHVKSTSDHLAFELGMPRPFYEVRVLKSHAGDASSLLTDIDPGWAWAGLKRALSGEPAEPDTSPDEEGEQ